MTTLTTMYAGQTNSPATTLASNITSSATSITVSDASALPAVPFPLTIGINSTNSETVLVTAKNSNTLTVTRGWDGAAAAWNADTPCARTFTAKDLDTVQSNIGTLNTDKAEQADVDAAVNELYDDIYANSASGELAHFYRTVGGLPVDDLLVHITPYQAGSGDPSPSNIRAISGYTGCNITKAGQNILDQSKYDTSITTIRNMTAVWGNDGSLTINGTSNNSSATVVALTDTFYLPAGTYVFSGAGNAAATTVPYLRLRGYKDGTTFTIKSASGEFTLDETCEADLVIFVRASSKPNNLRFEPMVSLISAPYEQYKGSTITYDWQSTAGTVYGGTLDVTTGVLTVTDANIASYAGETLPSTWISDRDVYAAGTTPTTGAQVVYKVASPTTYQLTATEVAAFLGENNIFASTGTSTVTFGSDIKNYIDDEADSKQDTITASGILKGNGSGTVSAAVAGTDYQAPLTAGTDYQTPLAEEKLQYYGVCSTSASTQAKTVSITGITALTTGLEIRVKMTNAQTYNGTPTLNVNSLGAKNIMQHGTTAAVRYQWQAGEVVSLTYDGTYWVLENNSLATTTYFGLTRLSSATNSTAEDSAATPAAVKAAYDLAGTAIPSSAKGAASGVASLDANSKVTAEQASSYMVTVQANTTLTSSHAGCMLVCSGDITITIPSTLTAGTEIEILNYGTGTITVTAASGVSLNGAGAGSKTIPDQYTSGVLKAISASQWVIQGAIA